MKGDDVTNHIAFENRLYFGSFQPEKHKTEAYQLKVTTCGKLYLDLRNSVTLKLRYCT